MPTKTKVTQNEDWTTTTETTWWGVWNVAFWGDTVRDARGMPVNWVTRTLGTAEDRVATWTPDLAHAVRAVFDRLECRAHGQEIVNRMLWHAGIAIFPTMALVALPILLVAGWERRIPQKYAVN